jgi:hypothetical protein
MMRILSLTVAIALLTVFVLLLGLIVGNWVAVSTFTVPIGLKKPFEVCSHQRYSHRRWWAWS